jgi:hypothetical protein
VGCRNRRFGHGEGFDPGLVAAMAATASWTTARAPPGDGHDVGQLTLDQAPRRDRSHPARSGATDRPGGRLSDAGITARALAGLCSCRLDRARTIRGLNVAFRKLGVALLASAYPVSPPAMTTTTERSRNVQPAAGAADFLR